MLKEKATKNFFKKEQMTSFSSGRLCPTWTISWGLWWKHTKLNQKKTKKFSVLPETQPGEAGGA